MRKSETIIEFTPIEELFSQEELLSMILTIKPKPHYCFIHSCLFAVNMAKNYPSIEYHEGIYTDRFYVHAWNSVIKDGRRHYFDFTGYFLEKKMKLPREQCAIMLRSYSPREIFKLMFKKNIQCCQIEWDGTYKRFIDNNFKKEKDEANRIDRLFKTVQEYEKEHEILCPCVSC